MMQMLAIYFSIWKAVCFIVEKQHTPEAARVSVASTITSSHHFYNWFGVNVGGKTY